MSTGDETMVWFHHGRSDVRVLRSALAAALMFTAMLDRSSTAAAASQSLSPSLVKPTSKNTGTYCARGYDAASLKSFFGTVHGVWVGADYQRAYKLADGRVLWTFQDALINTPTAGTKIVHNVGMIQSGRCFNLLGTGLGSNNPRPWLMADATDPFRTWYWPMGGEMDANGSTFHMLLAKMSEHGSTYLSNTAPEKTLLVHIRLSDLRVNRVAPAPNDSAELYGFSVASDARYSYLYSHCQRQFPLPGHCAETMKVARVPRGVLDATPSYWNGTRWTANDDAAKPVVSKATTGFGINPGQVLFDGSRFLLIEKEGDWFGKKVVIQSASNAMGPWKTILTLSPANPCGGACNTYFASWVPWRETDGRMIFGISHNRWDGRPSKYYRPTNDAVAVP
jgi:hypothetical protein